MHAALACMRKTSPRPRNLVQHLRPLGVVGNGQDRGPGQHQLRVAVVRDVLGKAQHHPQRVLEPVPTRDLGDEWRRSGGHGTGAQDLGQVVDATG